MERCSQTWVGTLIDASHQTIFDLVGDVSWHSELAESGEVLRVSVLAPGGPCASADGPAAPAVRRRIQWWFRLTPKRAARRRSRVEVDFNPVANVVFNLP